MRQSYENGNLFFGVAAVSLAAGGVAYYHEKAATAEAVQLGMLRRDMNALAVQQDERRRERTKALPTDPALFQARVTRRVVGTWAFNGPLALTAVGVGDVVDVIEESVGPDSSYHRCRAKTQAGLYPIHFLERVGNDGAPLPTDHGDKAAQTASHSSKKALT